MPAPPAPSGLTAVAGMAGSSVWIDLAWTNGGGGAQYDAVHVERKVTGGSYSEIISLGGVPTSWQDLTALDGTEYSYRVRGEDAEGNYSNYSNEATAATELPAPTTLDDVAAPTSVALSWIDNSQNESGFKIYRTAAGGATYSLLDTVAANVTSYNDTGLTAGQWYKYYVVAYNALKTSLWSNELSTFTADPPNAPSGLTVTAIATTKARLNWTDNADNETLFKIERSADGVSYAQITTVAANVTTYEDTGLVSNTRYWYRVRAYNDSGNSAYCTAADATTWAAIAQPTNPRATAWGSGTVEITFDDNSESETYHNIEQSDDGVAGWAVIKQLEPNRSFYRVTGLGAGTTKYWRIRAQQGTGGGASYSSYSDTVSATTLSTPGAPTGLAVSEYQDTWLRLTWANPSGSAGTKIERYLVDGKYTEVANVAEGVTYYKATGLSASTLYYFRVRGYNGAGDGSYTSAVTQTTRASHLASSFEKLCRRPKAPFVFLVEINPAMTLSGWTLTGGKTYTYETLIQDKGRDFDGVEENGVAMTEKASTADVESNASSWYYDASARKMYVHSSTGADPVNFYYRGSFWAYFTPGAKRAVAAYNGQQYLPLVASDGIPDVSQQIARYYQGGFVLTTGGISLLNGYSKAWGGYYFDTRFDRWLWLNRKVRILAGAASFAYADFAVIASAVIYGAEWSAQRVSFTLKDYRESVNPNIPDEFYSTDVFVNLDTAAKDKVRPFHYGAVTNFVPVCVDTTSRVYELQNGRIKSVEAVYQNGTALVDGTDYFVDFQRGRVVLSSTLTWASSDIVTANFTGAVDNADVAIKNGGRIFFDLQRRHVGLAVADLDLDSIYATVAGTSADLVLPLYREGVSARDVVARIERSIMAYSFQDSQGRIGLKMHSSAAASDAKYLIAERVFAASANLSVDDVYGLVQVRYCENPKEDRFFVVEKTASVLSWKTGVKKPLEVDTALYSASDASSLATSIVALLGKGAYPFEADRLLMTVQAGDLVYFSWQRFPNSSGSAANLLVRILTITKQFNAGRTSGVFEVVA